MNRPVVSLCLLLMTAGAASAQYYFDYPTYKKFEIGVCGGVALSNAPFAATMAYQDHWSDLLLVSVTEASAISLKAGAGLPFGLHVSYFFTPRIGIRLEVGQQRSDVSALTDFTFNWAWADGRYFQNQRNWEGTGRATTLPVGLDLIWKKGFGRHEGFFAGGLSCYRHTFWAESSFGYGISKMSDDGSEQYIDALRVGLKIPKMSWTSLGFNLGLGLNIKLSGLVGVRIEGGYWFSPKKRAALQFVKGDYDGVFFGNIKGINFNDGDIQLLTAGFNPKMPTSVRLNSSFIRLALGLVFSLGSAEY